MLLRIANFESFSKTFCKINALNYGNVSLFKNKIRFLTTDVNAIPKPTIRSMYKVKKKNDKQSASKYLLLIIPAATFGLGTWQIKRKIEKEQLISRMQNILSLEPVSLPENLEELQHMEYHPVKVKGKFDHSREIYMGPRSNLNNIRDSSSVISSPTSGFWVITPFKLSDRNLTILVNRGWVPKNQISPETRTAGQITDEVEIVGLVRLNQNRIPLGPKNTPEKKLWMYRDLIMMSQVLGTEPVFIDAVKKSSIPGGPIGGQTIINFNNNHLSYIITWYGLSAATTLMWYNKFIYKGPF